MQCKDISDAEVLASVRAHKGLAGIFIIWGDDFRHLPFKLFKAKMDRLGARGLVDCCCNECSGYIKVIDTEESVKL